MGDLKHDPAAAGLKQDAVSLRDAVVLGVAGAAPIMCIGGSMMTLFQQTGFGISSGAAVAAVIFLLVGLSYGDLAVKHNSCGGNFVYVARVLGNKCGLWTCAMYYFFMAVTQASPPAIFATYLNTVTGIPLPLGWVIFTAICIVISLAGVENTMKMTVGIFAAEMLMLLIPAAGVLMRSPGGLRLSVSVSNAFIPTRSAGGFMACVLTWMSSYVGIEAPSFMGEELRGGGRSVGRAIKYSVLLTGGIYVAACWLWTAALDPAQMEMLAVCSDPLAAYCRMVDFPAGEAMISCGVMLGAIACGTAFYAIMPRFIYDQARQGILPPGAARLTSRGVPVVGLVIYAVLSFLASMYALYAYGGVCDGINDIFAAVGGLAGISYIMICICNLKEHRGEKGLRALLAGRIFPAAAIAAMLAVLLSSGTKYVILFAFCGLVSLAAEKLLQRKGIRIR